MSERLDRIESALDRVAQQQERNTSGIDDLLGTVAQTDRQVQDTCARVDKLVDKVDESNQRFEVLRAEAQADREENRRNADMLTANIQRLEQSIAKLSDNVALMVEENRSQRETVNNLIRLCTALVEKKAS